MTQNVFDSFQLTVADLVMNSTLTAKVVLLILLIFSILSWTIMLNKLIVYKSAKKEDDHFLSIFAKFKSLNSIYNACKEFRYSPIARIFLVGYHELYLFQEMAKRSPHPLLLQYRMQKTLPRSREFLIYTKYSKLYAIHSKKYGFLCF